MKPAITCLRPHLASLDARSAVSPPTERIRGRALQAIRERVLRANPLCVHCLAMGLVRAASQVDHIIALCNGGPDVDSNRQGLCDECHRAKSALDQGLKVRPAVGVDGWPVVCGVPQGAVEKFQGEAPETDRKSVV